MLLVDEVDSKTFFMKLFAKGSKSTLKGRVIYSVLLTAIIYVVYIYVFGLSLPSGALF